MKYSSTLPVSQMEFFKDNFRNAEEQDPVKGEVKGTLPSWLNGDLIQCGPGKFDFGDFTVKHWFDGMAILQKFHFSDGQVEFSKKFLQSDSYKAVTRAKKTLYTEFGTRCHPDPQKNFFSRMYSSIVPGDLTDNCGVNVFQHSDSFYTATETCFLRKVKTEDLSTGEKVDLNKCPGVNMASCHPLTDPEDGTTYNLGCVFMTATPKYYIYKVPPKAEGVEDAFSKAEILCPIPSRWNAGISYYHSFSMTKNYLIFVDMPLKLSTIKMAQSAAKGLSLSDCMEWKPEERNIFYVIEKKSGTILKQTYKSSDAFFFFHQINAYEEDNQVVVDLLTYPDMSNVHALFLKEVRSNKRPTDPNMNFQRFVLPLLGEAEASSDNLVSISGSKATAKKEGDTVVVTPENICPGGWDLPGINKKNQCECYRFVYGCGMFHVGYYQNSLSKVDLDTKEVKIWKENDACFPGEPIFISSPEPETEDTGLVVASVLNTNKDSPDFLIILDAKEFKEVARVNLPSKIVFTVHGLFVPK